MIDQENLFDDLERIGLGTWREPLRPLLSERFADTAHGDIHKWRAVIDNLPDVPDTTSRLDLPTNRPELTSITVSASAWSITM